MLVALRRDLFLSSPCEEFRLAVAGEREGHLHRMVSWLIRTLGAEGALVGDSGLDAE